MKLKSILIFLGIIANFNLFAEEFLTPTSSLYEATENLIDLNVKIKGEPVRVVTKNVILVSSRIPECNTGCSVKIKTDGVDLHEFRLALQNRKQSLVLIRTLDPDANLPNSPFKVTYGTNWLGIKSFTTILDLDELRVSNKLGNLKTEIVLCSKDPEACRTNQR